MDSERQPTTEELSYQVPARKSGIPDEETMSDLEGGSSACASPEPGAVSVRPTIDPLNPGDQPEVDAWFAEQARVHVRRRRQARAERFFDGGRYLRGRLLGR